MLRSNNITSRVVGPPGKGAIKRVRGRATHPITAGRLAGRGIWEAGQGSYSLTTLECMFRESVLRVEEKLEADESPAAGEMRWFGDDAAAMGTENRDRKREEDARRKAEANSLAVGVVIACYHGRAGAGAGVGGGRWAVGRRW